MKPLPSTSASAGRMVPRFCRLLRRVCQDERGVTAVEFSMLIPVFIMILFLVIQFGYRYYYISIVHEQTFALGQAIIQSATRPANLAAAKTQFSNSLSSAYGITAASSYKLYVGQVTGTVPSAGAAASDYYAPQTAVPVLVRIVYPSKQLINLPSLMPYWPGLFGNDVDVSIVIVPK